MDQWAARDAMLLAESRSSAGGIVRVRVLASYKQRLPADLELVVPSGNPGPTITRPGTFFLAFADGPDDRGRFTLQTSEICWGDVICADARREPCEEVASYVVEFQAARTDESRSKIAARMMRSPHLAVLYAGGLLARDFVATGKEVIESAFYLAGQRALPDEIRSGGMGILWTHAIRSTGSRQWGVSDVALYCRIVATLVGLLETPASEPLVWKIIERLELVGGMSTDSPLGLNCMPDPSRQPALDLLRPGTPEYHLALEAWDREKGVAWGRCLARRTPEVRDAAIARIREWYRSGEYLKPARAAANPAPGAPTKSPKRRESRPPGTMAPRPVQ